MNPLTSKGDGQFTGALKYNPFVIEVGKSVLKNEDNTESFTVLSVDRILRGSYYDTTIGEWINFSEILLGGINTISFAAVALVASVSVLAF